MRILLTGACGKLGRKLLPTLSRSHEVVGIDRVHCDSNAIHRIDLTASGVAWQDLLDGVDTVVHLAACSHPDSEWHDLKVPNIELVNSLYAACVGRGIRRVVFASSNHVLSGYRNSPEIPLLNSDTPPWPGNLYGLSKLYGEQVGRHHAERSGIHVVNLRIGWNPPSRQIFLRYDCAWTRWFWLSDDDLLALFECALNSPLTSHSITVNGVSANRASPWDIDEGERLIGYRPRDEVSEWLGGSSEYNLPGA